MDPIGEESNHTREEYSTYSPLACQGNRWYREGGWPDKPYSTPHHLAAQVFALAELIILGPPPKKNSESKRTQSVPLANPTALESTAVPVQGAPLILAETGVRGGAVPPMTLGNPTLRLTPFQVSSALRVWLENRLYLYRRLRRENTQCHPACNRTGELPLG